MPEFVCRSCNLKVPLRMCQTYKSDKHTYKVKVLRTAEEVEELLRKRDKRNEFNTSNNTNING